MPKAQKFSRKRVLAFLVLQDLSICTYLQLYS